ncbi:MAG: DMT family transporter [Leptospiraceae bacterium]|nr:DMT family transporter [Leptospiraceae bacterium]
MNSLKPKNKQNLLGVIFVLISTISFSAKSVFAKLAYQELNDSVTMLFLRMGMALPFFLLASLRTPSQNYQLTLHDKFKILFLGIIGYYLASLFDFWGLEYIPAGMERVILFIYPTFVVILAAFLLKKKPEKKEFLALFITYSGILLIFIKEKFWINQRVLIGGSLVLASAFCYSLYLIGSEKLISKMGATKYTSYALSISGICIILHFLVTRDLQILLILSKKVYFLGFLMAILSTVVPTFLLTQGIKRIGSSKSAILGTLGPVSTIALGYYLLDEKIGVFEILGTVLILLGVIVISGQDF